MTVDLPDVEIFATGTWNGVKVTEKDLDDMVSSFAKIGKEMKPYLKLGHSKEQGLLQKDGYPAAGWIDNVRRVGGKMVSDFKAVPQKVAELIRNKAYGRFSPEVYFNAVFGGEKYPRVLKAVAILGGDTPACTTLDDFIDLYGMKESDLVRVFESEVNGELVTLTEESGMEIKELEAKLEAERALRVESDRKFSESQKAVEALKADKEKAESLRAESEKKFSAKEKEFKMNSISAKVESAIADRLKEGRILPAQVPLLRAFAVSDMVGHDEKGLRVFSYKEGDKESKVEFSEASELVFKLLDVMGKQVDFKVASEEGEKPAPNAGGSTDDSELAGAVEKAFAEAQKTNPDLDYGIFAMDYLGRKNTERS